MKGAKNKTMELKIFRDTICAMGPVCEAKAELPLEAEILIPDYLPQVFKVVKCFVHLVPLQKQISMGRLTVEGYLRCVVYYQAEQEQALCQTEQKIPFTRAMELPQAEYNTCSIQVSGQVEYLNCRALNQRRLDVRGAYALNARIAVRKEQEVVTALAECGIEQKMTAVPAMRPLLSVDKLITAEETIQFAKQPQAILDAAGVGHVEEIKLVSGKAVVKGKIQVSLLYRGEESTQLEVVEQSVPFNQILDTESLPQDSESFACVEMTGCTLMTASGQELSAQITVTAMLHLRIWRSGECYLVEDAFSTQYETQLTEQKIFTEQLACPLNQTGTGQFQVNLPDEEGQVVHCFAQPVSVELAQQEGKLVLQGRAYGHLLCLNSLGEMDCCDKAFEYQIPLSLEGEPQQYRLECWPTVTGIETTVEQGQATVKVQWQLEGLVFRRTQQTIVVDVTCTDPLEQQQPDIALRIYYAKAGEHLFDIAKRYHLPPADLMKANEFEQPVLEQAQRLLIPSTV